METLIYAMLNVYCMIVISEDLRESGFIGGYIAAPELDETATRANRAVGRRLALVADRVRQE